MILYVDMLYWIPTCMVCTRTKITKWVHNTIGHGSANLIKSHGILQ